MIKTNNMEMLTGNRKEFSNKVIMEQAEKVGLWTALSCLELKYTAWKYFLPIQNARTALVFDAALGLDSISLSQHVNRIVSVVFDLNHAIFLSSRCKEYRNIDIILASKKSDLPFAIECFDLVIARDISIMGKTKECQNNFFPSIEGIKKIVNIKGSLLIGFNQKAISFKKGKSELILNEEGIGTCVKVRNYIRNHNLFIKEIIHCLPNQFRMNEILLENFYSQRNVRGNYLKEKLKSIALTYCLPILKFSDLIIVVKKPDSKFESLLSLILLEVIERLCLNSDNFKVLAINIVSPNTLLCIAEHEKKGMIIRLPMDRESTIRVERQKNILILLRKKVRPLDSFLPRQLKMLSLKGQDVYIEQRLDGIIISGLIHSFSKYEASAVQWLLEFQNATRKDVLFNEDLFEELVSIPLKKLRTFVSKESEVLIVKSLSAFLYKKLFNKPISLVCMHGDYKIENILFDREAFKVRGVIDWDLAQMNSLPVLDILYLFAYSNKLRNPDMSISQIFADMLKNQQLSETNQKYLSIYFKTLSIDSGMFQEFCILGWLYHIVYRFGDLMKLYPMWYEENISRILLDFDSILQLSVDNT